MLAGAVFLFEVAVDGKEGHATLFAKIYSFLEEIAFAHGPQNESVAVFHELTKGCGGKWKFFADSRVSMFDDCAVKIYCNDHFFMILSGLYHLLA